MNSTNTWLGVTESSMHENWGVCISGSSWGVLIIKYQNQEKNIQGTNSDSKVLLWQPERLPCCWMKALSESGQREANGAPSLTDAWDGAKEVFVKAVVQCDARLLRRHQWVRGWQRERFLLHSLSKGRERRNKQRWLSRVISCSWKCQGMCQRRTQEPGRSDALHGGSRCLAGRTEEAGGCIRRGASLRAEQSWSIKSLFVAPEGLARSPSRAQMPNTSLDCFFPQKKPHMLFLTGTLVFLSHQKSSQMSNSDLQKQHWKDLQACSFVWTPSQWRNYVNFEVLS